MVKTYCTGSLKAFLFLSFLILIFAQSTLASTDSLIIRKAGYIKTGEDSLSVIIYTNIRASGNPVLLISLHGDYNFPGYHYKLARLEAEQNTNLVSVGILRPGYTNEMGNKSAGTMGNRSGDNYTREVIDKIASVIMELKNRFNPERIIIAGHSGGAAIAGDLIGLYPKLADCVILVSCPCIVDQWRNHMYVLTKDNTWTEPVKSISPISVIDSIDRRTRIILFQGDKDDVVPSAIAEHYAEMLGNRHYSVELIKLPS